jgi:hypothetical protein
LVSNLEGLSHLLSWQGLRERIAAFLGEGNKASVTLVWLNHILVWFSTYWFLLVLNVSCLLLSENSSVHCLYPALYHKKTQHQTSQISITMALPSINQSINQSYIYYQLIGSGDNSSSKKRKDSVTTVVE